MGNSQSNGTGNKSWDVVGPSLELGLPGGGVLLLEPRVLAWEDSGGQERVSAFPGSVGNTSAGERPELRGAGAGGDIIEGAGAGFWRPF